MIRFYFHPTPNPAKVALFLEEAGLPYEAIPVDTSKGEQHTPAFRAINPNGKVPAIVDTDGPGGKEARVFDSTAILLYLAEKTGKFLGTPEDRPELLSWLLFIASGPRPVLRPGRAFPVRRARGPGLRGEPLSARGRAALPGAERPPGRPRLHRRRQLHDRRYVGLGLARPRVPRPQGRRRSARSVPSSEASLSRPSMRGRRSQRARAVGKDHDFKKVSDEETKRALFPSNYPPAA